MRQLSARDRDATLDVCDELLSITSQDQILHCINGRMKSLIGYEGVLGGIGDCEADGLVPSLVLGHDFPEDYLSKITSHGRLRPQTLRFWAQKRQPLALDFSGGSGSKVTRRAAHDANRFGFFNMLCHGQVHPGGKQMTYVTFTRIEGTITERQKRIVSLTMPHLHNALVRAASETSSIFKMQRSPDLSWADLDDVTNMPLDLRKKQILYLIGLGKTNWEIGQILGTSENNVKNHLKRLNAIFETCSRSAAVTEAIRRGAMPDDWPLE